MPPPMAARSKNRGGSTSVRGRVRSPHISGGRRWLRCRQPACLQPRQLRHGTDGRIALFQNAPLGWGHNNTAFRTTTLSLEITSATLAQIIRKTRKINAADPDLQFQIRVSFLFDHVSFSPPSVQVQPKMLFCCGYSLLSSCSLTSVIDLRTRTRHDQVQSKRQMFRPDVVSFYGYCPDRHTHTHVPDQLLYKTRRPTNTQHIQLQRMNGLRHKLAS